MTARMRFINVSFRRGAERPLAAASETDPAAAFWAVILLSLGAKLAHAMDIAIVVRSARPFVVLPLAVGTDLVVVAVIATALGLLRRALGGWRGARLVFALLVPWAFLLCMNVMSHRLTGGGITWQRLRGDEGATLEDLQLLSTADLGRALTLIAFAALIVPLCLFVCRRSALLRRAAHPLAPLPVALLGLALMASFRLVEPQAFGLEHNAVVVLTQSLLLDEDELLDVKGLELDSEGWRRLQQPTLEERETPLGPNVEGGPITNIVIVLAEGVPYRYTSFGSSGRDMTPRLRERVEREGVVFDRFYATYHSSIQSIFSLVCSAYPPMHTRKGNIVAQRPRIDCGELSEHLQRAGRRVGLFHGGRFAYYDKLALLGDRGYDVALDAESLKKRYPRRELHKWGIDDRALVDATLEFIDEGSEDAPFGALLIPITAHYPYWTPSDVKPRFPGEERGDRFSNAVASLDDAIDSLIRGLEERGLYDETLVVVVADHGERVDPLTHRRNGFRLYYQQNLHVPLVLLNPRLFPSGPRVSHRTGSMVDVVPTVLDLADLPPDPRHFGQSLVSDHYEPRRLFFGAFAGSTTFVGFVEGDTKLALDLNTRDVEVYDLGADPEEQHPRTDISDARLKQMKHDALTFYRANRVYFLKAPVLQGSASVHERVLEGGVVARSLDDEQTLCARNGRIWTCPGADGEPSFQEKARRVDGRISSCLEVSVPVSPAAVELSIESDVLALLSGVRVGIPDRYKASAKGELSVDVVVDREPVKRARLRGRQKMVWVQFAPPTERLRLRLTRTRDDAPERACLLLSDLAWRAIDNPGVVTKSTLDRP